MFFLGTDHVRGKISEHIFVVSRSYGTNVIRRRIGTNQNEKALSGTWTPQSMFKTVYLWLKTWFRMQFSVNEHEKISLAFEKTTKFHEPVGRVWLVVFKKIASAYLHQIAREIMLFLINSLHEKGITDSQDRRNFDSASAICQFEIVLQLCTRFTGKIHSFLANQKRVIFSSILLHELSGSVTRDRFYHTISFGLLLMWTSWTILYSFSRGRFWRVTNIPFILAFSRYELRSHVTDALIQPLNSYLLLQQVFVEWDMWRRRSDINFGFSLFHQN